MFTNSFSGFYTHLLFKIFSSFLAVSFRRRWSYQNFDFIKNNKQQTEKKTQKKSSKYSFTISLSIISLNPQRTIKINSGIKIFQRVFLLIKHIKLQTGEIISTKSSSTYRVYFFFFCIFCLSAGCSLWGVFRKSNTNILCAVNKKKGTTSKKAEKKLKQVIHITTWQWRRLCLECKKNVHYLNKPPRAGPLEPKTLEVKCNQEIRKRV